MSFLIILTYEFQANPDTQINTGLLSLFGLSNFYLLFIKNDYFNKKTYKQKHISTKTYTNLYKHFYKQLYKTKTTTNI